MLQLHPSSNTGKYFSFGPRPLLQTAFQSMSIRDEYLVFNSSSFVVQTVETLLWNRNTYMLSKKNYKWDMCLSVSARLIKSIASFLVELPVIYFIVIYTMSHTSLQGLLLL